MTSKYQMIVRELINERQFSKLEFDDALHFFCQEIGKALSVGRVGIWKLNPDQTEIQAISLWNSVDGKIQADNLLTQDQAKRYFEVIKTNSLLSFDDAINDPRCSELAHVYLLENGISSMLDCPIHIIGKMVGILCIEHTGPKRVWTDDEKDFAITLASLISLTFENQERIEVEEIAMRQTERLKFYANLATDWQWETDANHKLINVVGTESFAGRRVEDVLGRALWDVENLDPTSGTWTTVQSLFAKKSALNDFVVSAVSPSGEVFYGELSGRARFDKKGEFLGYWGAAKNITEKYESERALRSSEKKYRDAVRLANVGAWVWDEIEGRITYCSDELAEIYGVSSEELIARTVASKIPSDAVLEKGAAPYKKDLSWVHCDDRETYRRVIEKAHRDKSGYEVVTRIVRDDGSIRTIHELCGPVFDGNGQFVATTGVLLDITDQESQKEQLRQSREQLSNLMDNIPGALYRVKNDADRTPVYTSAGFSQLFGVTKEEGETNASDGFSYHRVLKERDLRMIEAAVLRAIEDEGSYEFEYPVYREESQPPIWLFERGRPVKTPAGDIELEGVIIEVTDKHEAQEALVRSQRLEAVGHLTGGIAHDFNNLLAVILGNLELLQLEASELMPTEYIDTAISATLRGADLTKSLLSFARKASLNPSRFNINTSIVGVQNWINRTLPENISIRTKLNSTLWEIDVDHSLTESLILNLILNARDAMPEGGKLTVETSNEIIDYDIEDAARETLGRGRYVVLTVTDTGHGIPKDVLDQIFEPFFTTKAPGKGSGLGLSMVHGFIKQSGGTVQVHSEANVGTTFKIYFCAADDGLSSELPVETNAAAELMSMKLRILLAEDEIEVAKILAKTLEKFGCSVVTAASGDEALSLFQANPTYDLLLTDIVMPGELMGTHLAKSVREIREDFPVIFMSGYADEALVHGNGLISEDIRLSKPVSQIDLMEAVRLAMASEFSGNAN
ncbi:PAS domain S-box protein [Antarctobacter jejuensis]|uniref:PAS domain S-box protein n=1 Tax=Antarctobacter jejuensis TaxID=1439938 RepID=UPI003FD21B48